MVRGDRIACYSNLLLSVSIGFLLFSVVSSQIPLGSKLTVEENNCWVSSNGDYAVGFLNSSDQYIFGIRFNSIYIPSSEQTAIWTAGNVKVSSKAYFELSRSGEMILFDPATEKIAWQNKTGNASVESAVLLDNGNFVLLNRNKSAVWQSFESPSDTLLPGQSLSVGHTLRASSRDSLASYYSLVMNVSGEMQLRWDSTVIYWTVGGPSQPAVRSILGSDGILRLIDQRSKVVSSVYGEDYSDPDVKFRFLRLDSDGNLRMYSWKTNATSWTTVWQAVINQCDVFATCANQGICIFNASDSYVCQCPFRSTRDTNTKCLIPYKPTCESGSSMIRYDHMYLYGIYPPNKTVVQTNLQQCRSLCQKDPSCHAASFINNGTAQCHMMKSQYVGGQSDPSLGSITFVKTCSDPIAVLPAPVPAPRKVSQKICVACLLEVAAGSVVVFFMLQFGIGVYLFRRRKSMMQKSVPAHTVPNATGCIVLSYSEIKDLTDNFKKQIGQNVFEGVLPDTRLVAVKDLNASIEERRFRSAVLKIGSIYHKNLLRLDGYCCESGRRLLVYELAKYGSIDKCLEEPRMCKRLTWTKRIDICLSVARAISYLHTGCREFVSHGNLKCENVFLDEELEAKVSEFGLRTIQAEASSSGGLAETDVRDFGKMMVVLITGRQDADEACYWAYEKWVKAEREMAIDQRIEGGVDLEELERAFRIAFWCLQGDERMRPSMGEVVKVLEGTLSVDPPPPPFAYNQQRPPEDESLSESYSEL
ncbi:G-type lectin S-receptor-like serine/threonine-protein kinase SD3-1 [Nicotiana tabacum]|uniref:G-type lectin S-receptor-like serine/threonine-protein kinase SD3-1 n=1 Tax=Nicotiana tabacum TaxID=4097 RepID=UPI003F4E4895